jgi:hypothetical protein
MKLSEKERIKRLARVQQETDNPVWRAELAAKQPKRKWWQRRK